MSIIYSSAFCPPVPQKCITVQKIRGYIASNFMKTIVFFVSNLTNEITFCVNIMGEYKCLIRFYLLYECLLKRCKKKPQTVHAQYLTTEYSVTFFLIN